MNAYRIKQNPFGIILDAASIVILLITAMGSQAGETPRSGLSVDFKHGALKVSDNKRFLVHEDSAPFFYLGDTAWELFHRLNRDEAERYLENRRQKGFTVIQAVVLAELDGLNTPNAYGEKPLIGNDPAQPNEAYFKHVDFIVKTAEEKGIFIGMLPTWGDKVVKNAWGKGPVVFSNEKAKIAENYGKFLGGRYKNAPNIIWILIGDRDAKGYEAVWRAMAKGLKEGDGGGHLITVHPAGGRSSSDWFHNDGWLDFNMLQSGHSEFNLPNYEKIVADYSRVPIKPCMDGEPRYEDHPVNWNPKNGWFDDFDVRQAAYWALFAGAFGHTYGCHDIWQMMAPGRDPISSARNNWFDALDLPGAWDMLHVRRLLLSRPFLSRIPDQSLIVVDQQDGAKHIQACKGDHYAFVYIPYGQSIAINVEKIPWEKCKAWWFDPRTGKADPIGVLFDREPKVIALPEEIVRNASKTLYFARDASMRLFLDPPGKIAHGADWVLVLDDASQNYPPPGEVD
ncbi:MAG: glycoside hydrolase family 140 protein [Candidatus Omnitrophota bacterium]